MVHTARRATCHDARRTTEHTSRRTARYSFRLSVLAVLGAGLTAPWASAAPENGPESSPSEIAETASSPTAVHQSAGESLPDTPDTLEFSDDPDDVHAVAAADGEELTSQASRESPQQVFTLEHPGGEQPVRWVGTVDPERSVILLAWHAERHRWDEVARSTGAAPEQSALEAELGDAYAEDGRTHLAVVAEDGFRTGSEEITPPAAQQPTGDFLSPADYDFGIAHVTDTQFLAEGAVDDSLAPDARDRFAEAYRAQMQWVAENAESRSIAYMAHTGDIIENWMIPGVHTEQQAREEFAFASQMQGIVDEAGVPNGILPGNHDNWWGTEGNHLFNDYFPAARYEQASQSWEDASYGGPWRDDDNSAHYDLFTAGGQDFIAVHMPYGHTHAQRSWARNLLAEFPDRDAILFTHAYLRASNAADAAKPQIGGYGGGGLLLRDQVVAPSENVFLVLSGHYHGTAWHVNRGTSGGPTVEMLGDYQNYEVDGERSTGFLRFLQFDVDAGEMTVNTYSPRLDEHGAVHYDTGPRSYAEGTDEFTVPVDLSTRQTTLATDQLVLGDLPALPGGAETEVETHRETAAPRPAEEPDDQASEEPRGGSAQAPTWLEDATVTRGERIDPIDLGLGARSTEVQVTGLPEGLYLQDYETEGPVSWKRSIGGVPAETGTFEITFTAFGDDGTRQVSTMTLTVEE